MSDEKTTDKLLTAKALGEMLSLSKRQVHRLNACGKIPAPIRIGGAVRWSLDTIRCWLNLGAPDRDSFEVIQWTGGDNCV